MLRISFCYGEELQMLGHSLLLVLFSINQNFGPLCADYEGLCGEAMLVLFLREEAHLPVS